MSNEIFLKIDDLVGDSEDKAGNAHKGEITVLGWSWGMSQTGTTHHSKGGGAGKVSINDISFTKRADTSSHRLHQSCCDGTHFKQAIFTMRKAGGKDPLEFVKIELSDLIVSSITASISPESETLIENVTLNFAKFKMTYNAQDTTGTALGGDLVAKWDIPGNVPEA